MCKELICVASLVVVLSLAGSTSADLVAHWKFDDGSGTTAVDSSGNGYHAILVDNPEWVPGKIGPFALNLEAGGYGGIRGMFYQSSGIPEVTVCAWIRTSSGSGQFIASFDRNEYWRLALSTESAATGQVGWHVRTDAGQSDYASGAPLNDGQWHHVCGVFDNGTSTIYIDGEPEPSTQLGSTMGRNTLRYGYIGKNSEAAVENQAGPTGNPLDGDLDDLRIYDHALTQAEIRQAMKGLPPGVATDPSPGDEATDVPREVVLSWKPGEFAPAVNGHRVYFGESFNDVNDGIGGTTVSTTSYALPERLDLETTYYWRVDEVNAPPDSAVHKGEIWYFTTELVAYPLDGAKITATASSSGQAELGPQNTINGSGLDEKNLHSTVADDMWLSGNELAGAWIQYEFDKVHKLHEMWVWNANQSFEGLFGFGFKDVTVEYSANGVDWTALAGISEFARAPGTVGYAHNTTVDFGGAAAKYVKLTAASNWGGILPQYGLSEVRFFAVPVSARKPSPESGAADMAVDGTLSWRPGRGAATHDVYLSTDEQAVIDGTAPAVTVPDASYSSPLDLASTYYWRIDEVNEAETPTTWQGDVWDFATQESIVVEDFEDYNDYPPHEIYTTWLDGYENPANGSQVGYLMPPIAETGTVHGGEQSMPLLYSNTGGAAYSETERTFAVPQDWTKHGIQTLVLYFHGTAGNTGQLYVKVNGVKVVFPGDAAAMQLFRWQQWNIDLASLGVNLASVTKLALGIDGNGAAGTLYVDDIVLYRLAPEIVVSSEELWIEAEAADTITAPMLVYDDPLASGGKYIGTTDDVGDSSDSPPADGIATYNFTVQGGTYKVSCRIIIPSGDSFWVRIPGATNLTPGEDPDNPGTGWVRWSDPPDSTGWYWYDVFSGDHGTEAANWTLPAGAYTLEIARREDGALLDAIVISKVD
ncbi:MAG: discoidin domain-containing protein [Phycisphaerales bacterium]|nr:MAG: discoidin domain-containing protein [Phycisphaerales bacterium]